MPSFTVPVRPSADSSCLTLPRILGASVPGMFLDQTPAVFKSSMELNYQGFVNVTYAALKSAAIPPSGINENIEIISSGANPPVYTDHPKRTLHMISVASTLAVMTLPGFSQYSPTKAAVRALTQS